MFQKLKGHIKIVGGQMMKSGSVEETVFNEERITYSRKLVIDLLRKVENKEVSVNDVIRKIESNKYKVCVYKNRIAEKIDVDDIYYITVLDGITRIFTEKDSYNSYMPLNEWEKRFNDIKNNKFYRSHRNYIVNLDKIVEIKNMSGWIMMTGHWFLLEKRMDYYICFLINNIKCIMVALNLSIESG